MTAFPRRPAPICAAVLAAALSACASAPPATHPVPAQPLVASTVPSAVAHVVAASGSLVSGTLRVTPIATGVRVRGVVGGLAPGSVHGFHVHETGACTAADASSAGAHFNPSGGAHGRPGTPVHHAGDMDNIVADAGGVAHVDTNIAGISLGGDPSRDIVGRALVVHAAPDDYRTQPSGNSGARIACGVIRAGTPTP